MKQTFGVVYDSSSIHVYVYVYSTVVVVGSLGQAYRLLSLVMNMMCCCWPRGRLDIILAMSNIHMFVVVLGGQVKTRRHCVYTTYDILRRWRLRIPIVSTDFTLSKILQTFCCFFFVFF